MIRKARPREQSTIYTNSPYGWVWQYPTDTWVTQRTLALPYTLKTNYFALFYLSLKF